MDITSVPFTTTDWTGIPEVAHAGQSGTAFWRTFESGNLRVRMVRYSPGYVADHWCNRGHALLVLSGELITELQDGAVHRLAAGMSYQVASGAAPHRSRTTEGASLFIVD
jgi:hypothetical protein